MFKFNDKLPKYNSQVLNLQKHLKVIIYIIFIKSIHKKLYYQLPIYTKQKIFKLNFLIKIKKIFYC